MTDDKDTTTWPDLAIGLYDRLTGRKAEITYEFDDMHIKIPSGTGAGAHCAQDGCCMPTFFINPSSKNLSEFGHDFKTHNIGFQHLPA